MPVKEETLSVWFAALLGLVQGAAEFLPVSSSGHLALLGALFPSAMPDTGLLFPVLLHLGTLVPLLADCRGELRELWGEVGASLPRSGTGERKRGLLLPLLLGTLPLAGAALLENGLEGLSTRPRFIAFVLLVNGGMLLLSDRVIPGRKGRPTPADGAAVGFAQALAVLPGLSRSGSTVTAGLLRGLDRAGALRFSFLLSIPAILGAGAVQLLHALRAPFDPALLPPCLAGAAAAAVSGAGFLRVTRRLVLRGRFGPFGWYCLALGLGVLLLAPAAG